MQYLDLGMEHVLGTNQYHDHGMELLKSVMESSWDTIEKVVDHARFASSMALIDSIWLTLWTIRIYIDQLHASHLFLVRPAYFQSTNLAGC